MSTAVLTALLCLSQAQVEVLTRDPAYESLVPEQAYDGAGSWSTGDYLVGTGFSVSAESLGQSKQKHTEAKAAELDCKKRLLFAAAAGSTDDFDEDMFEVLGEIQRFKTAATYRLGPERGLYLIGVVKKPDVKVEVRFDPSKARTRAWERLAAADYAGAAGLLAKLTQRGVQDEHTVAMAKAASWHVNLASNVSESQKREALQGLGEFYQKHEDFEQSLRFFYELYLETDNPETQLLATLADLCERTNRAQTAAKFRAALSQTELPKTSRMLRDFQGGDLYRKLITTDEALCTVGGSKVFDDGGSTYFVAVGSTDIRASSSKERMRQIKVARAQAQKEAVAYAEGTHVIAESSFSETTRIENGDGKTSGESVKTLNETIRTAVRGKLGSLAEVGTWTDADGEVFFFALGCDL